jgi:PAS domain S-box-containing protein
VAIRREGKSLKGAILDAALDCVITMDVAGRVLDFNRAAQETFGYSASEAAGRELAELIIPPDLREPFSETLTKQMRTKETHAPEVLDELMGIRKDASKLPLEIALTRVPETEPPIIAAYIRDMTEAKVNEDRIRAQAEEIARLAEARGELLAQLLLAEERTRRRIAQVLHDDALQRLLAAHQDLIEAAPGREGVSRAHKALEGTIGRLRDAVVALHPVTLQQGDLDTALSAIVRQHAARGGFRYTVRVEEEASGLEDDLVLSIARELVTNIAKHAGASRCSVTVTREGERVVLEVADDGRGIPQGRQEAALREGHIGLAAAIQRMKAIGGEMEVSSEAGRGTVIRGHFPIGEREPAERNR